MTEIGRTRHRLVDRLAIGILVGLVAVSVGGAGLLTVYLNRLGDAAEGLQRADALLSYEGRPSPVVIDGVNALNYLLMATDDNGDLQAVLIAHLSASRRDLTLIALPSDLLAEDGGGRRTLAASYAIDPLRAARGVEALTGARMDHQIRLRLHGFAGVVDTLGGIDVDGTHVSGTQLMSHLDAAPNAVDRSVRTAHLLRAAMTRANLGVAIGDPNRFDRVLDALTPCLTVDAELTGDEIRGTMVESRVRVDQVQAWALAATPTGSGSVADPAVLAHLRSALATDAFPRAGAPASPTAIPQTAVAGSNGPSPAATR